MDDHFISMLVGGAGAGGTVLSGLFAWWVKGLLSDIKKISHLTSAIVDLKTSVDRLSGKLDSMDTRIHQADKDIAVLQRDVKTAFIRYDEVSRLVIEDR